MSTALAKIDRSALVETLGNSLYPGASANSIGMVLGYCEAAGLDPMQKPVHIVPMWDSKIGQMRDVVMPGIGLYRVQASRTGQFGGMSEPEFGPDKEFALGGVTVTAPEWCKITVKRVLAGGYVAEFHATEYWIENYAQKGGKEKSAAPNAMWSKRPRGQLAKCAEAQALRKAFPEIGAAPTAEEMEGKQFIDGEAIEGVARRVTEAPQTPECSPELLQEAQSHADGGMEDFEAWFEQTTNEQANALRPHIKALKARAKGAEVTQ